MIAYCSIIASLPIPTQRLVALLFGTWFRVVNHCEYNAMTSEALAKSVAGSVFHTCATEPTMVSNAVQLIRVIIDNFGQPAMLGHANIQYFTERTSTAIKVREKYKYRLSGRCPLVTVDDADTLQVECGTCCSFLDVFTASVHTNIVIIIVTIYFAFVAWNGRRN